MSSQAKGTGIAGYNAYRGVDAWRHQIVAHEAMNIGSNHAQLSKIAKFVREVSRRNIQQTFADRGYFNGPEISAYGDAGVTPFVPKPTMSSVRADGHLSKADFIYVVPGVLVDIVTSGNWVARTPVPTTDNKAAYRSRPRWRRERRAAEGFSRDAKDRESHALEPYEVMGRTKLFPLPKIRRVCWGCQPASNTSGVLMAKSQLRSNREAKKPKQPKKASVPATPFGTVQSRARNDDLTKRRS
ncbi:hypothetical protein [Cupriavidus oxalaticus]|jgi:hypothetical protein|uniref:hypothetical protein n=1 Tax=Cupriavidus oxalaticus TaxID=96344 RepID=UPI00403354DE